MTTNKPERYTETENFLIDTRRLPPELRWKISGMVEAANVLNIICGVPGLPAAAQAGEREGTNAVQVSA